MLVTRLPLEHWNLSLSLSGVIFFFSKITHKTLPQFFLQNETRPQPPGLLRTLLLLPSRSL